MSDNLRFLKDLAPAKGDLEKGARSIRLLVTWCIPHLSKVEPFLRRMTNLVPASHLNVAFSVLTDPELLRHISSFQDGLPYLIGQFDSSLGSSSEIYNGKLPQFAIRRRDLEMLKLLQKATQNSQLQKLPHLQFIGVRRHAIEYNSLPILKWLHATRDKSPTLADEHRLLSAAVTSYVDNVDIMEWLHSASEGPQERIDSVTEVHVCRAAGLGNIGAIRWLHDHGSTAFSSLVMDTAATHGHLDLVRFLHENRSEGCTTRAMHGAALNGYHEIIVYLAQNRSEGPGEQTLTMTASAGHLCCVKVLCQFAQPPRGTGVWQFAEARQNALDSGHKEVARFLAQHRRHGTTAKENWRCCVCLF